jgi:hypothetical protein
MNGVWKTFGDFARVSWSNSRDENVLLAFEDCARDVGDLLWRFA